MTLSISSLLKNTVCSASNPTGRMTPTKSKYLSSFVLYNRIATIITTVKNLTLLDSI